MLLRETGLDVELSGHLFGFVLGKQTPWHGLRGGDA